MAITATGSAHSAGYIAESTYGTTPATPTFKNIRHTSASLGLSKSTLESAEISGDRQIKHLRHGNKSVAGDLGIELSYGSFDDFLEATLGGTWSGMLSITDTTISAASSDNSYNDSGAGLPVFTVGDKVIVSGFTEIDNNGTPTVVTSTVSKLVVSGLTLVLEVSGDTVTIVSDGDTLQAGSTRRSFSIERKFGNITTPEYHRYLGCEFNSMSLAVTPDAMITGTFSLIAQDASTPATAIISGATYSDATTTEPFDSFSGTITEGGSAIAIVTSVDFSIENGLNPMFVVGSALTDRPGIGKSRVTGTLTAFFQDSTLLNKFIAETASSLVFVLADPAGNTYDFTFPNIKYTGGQPDVSGEGEITISLPFTALYDATEGSNITIERNPV